MPKPRMYKGVELVEGARFISQLGESYTLTRREDGMWAALGDEILVIWAGEYKRNPVDAVWMLTPLGGGEEEFRGWLGREYEGETLSSARMEPLREAFMAGRRSMGGRG